jgi:hypothetical protein
VTGPPVGVLALLDELAAGTTGHRAGRSLETHLFETWRVLDAWKAPRHVAVAGLIHSIYGTDAFDVASIGHDEPSRARVRRAAGTAAESLAYAFCAIDRQAFLSDPFSRHLRNRFTHGVTHVTPRQISGLAEILLANEIDLACAKKAGDPARMATKVRPVAAALRPVLPRRVVAAISRPLGLG